MNRNILRKAALFSLALGLILTGAFQTMAQEEVSNPQRGFQPGSSYSMSDIESINTTNGNLVLNIPLAVLPAGRGGMRRSVSLTYNSKLYDTSVEELLDHSNQMTDQNMLDDSPDGGWKYTFSTYRVDVKSRFDTAPPIPCDGSAGQISKNIYMLKVLMNMPDGSAREFRPTGRTDLYNDGYFDISPSGYQMRGCNGSPSLATSSPMVYYSTDGSYSKLVFEHVAGADPWGQNSPWTLYLADGSRINSGGRTDRNGNTQSGLSDDVGRSISVQYNAAPNEDHITMGGAGNQELKWKVKWKDISVSKSYKTTAANSGRLRGGTSTQTASMMHRVVERITLPVQTGGWYYEFEYNSENAGDGWGEISRIKLPSGATTDYQFSTPLEWQEFLAKTEGVLRTHPTSKTLTYMSEYDGSTSAVSEVTQYSIGKTSSTITAPDGSVTTEKHGDISIHNPMSGLVKKIANSSGGKTERIWGFNRPTGANTTANINAYVKTEFTTIADGSGNPTLTAIKDITVDCEWKSDRDQRVRLCSV
ncbi:MAG: hypothetical protein WBD22_09655 [Pyrinomonadaceae bacterium]